MLPFIALNQSECFHSSSPISNVFLQKSRPVSNFSEPYPQIGRCRSVTCFEKLNRIGEGTYGIVCEYLIRFITDHRRSQGRKRSIFCRFVLQEAVSQTKCCCSLKVKIVWALRNFWAGQALPLTHSHIGIKAFLADSLSCSRPKDYLTLCRPSKRLGVWNGRRFEEG